MISSVGENASGTFIVLLVQKAYRLKLFPTKAQAESMARCAGSCRWLWNHLLALQKSTYEAEQKFIFRFEMQKLLPGLKSEHIWLKETPVHSLQRVCRNLDLSLKNSFRNGGGFAFTDVHASPCGRPGKPPHTDDNFNRDGRQQPQRDEHGVSRIEILPIAIPLAFRRRVLHIWVVGATRL